jgi:hypothetical protein
MIDRKHDLPVGRQAKELGISSRRLQSNRPADGQRLRLSHRCGRLVQQEGAVVAVSRWRWHNALRNVGTN